MAKAERDLLATVARAVLSGEHGDLESQLDRPVREPGWPRRDAPSSAVAGSGRGPGRREHLAFDNGFGGFSRTAAST